jgi:hypothetical protein
MDTTMNQSHPQLVDARTLTEVWVALTMARNITKQYLNDLPEGPGLQSLIKVLDVTRDLMDEMLGDAFPNVRSITTTDDLDFIM